MKAIKFLRAVLLVALGLFATFAVAQLFMSRRLPNALVYCLCAWILARVRNSL